MIALALLTSCTIYQPEIRGVESVKVNRNKEEGKGQLALKVGVRVFNPNTFKVALKRYNLAFSLNGKAIGTATTHTKIKMIPNEETVIPLQINTTTKKLGGAALWAGISGLTNGGKFTVRVTGNLRGKVRGVGKTYQVDHEELMDLELAQWLK